MNNCLICNDVCALRLCAGCTSKLRGKHYPVVCSGCTELFGQSLAVNWLKEEWFAEAMQKTLQSYVAAGRVFAAVVDTCETCEHVTPASVVKHLPHTERIN